MPTRLFSLLLIISLLTACGPASLSNSTASAPVPGPLVPVGEPEIRDLGPTSETVWNCGSGGGTVVKHPSMSVVTNYAVQWEIGGTTGVGLNIGEGVIPGGVNLSTSLEGRYASSFDQGVQQGTGWDLPAEPNSIVVYTLMWREIWQRGYVDVRLADQNVIRVNVRYRTGILSDIVGKQIQFCGDVTPVAQPSPVSQAQQQPTIVAPSQPSGSFTTEDLDAILGAGNWRCVDGFPNAVSIDSLPSNFIVRFPLIRVDARNRFYYKGDIVPDAGYYATGWLAGDLPNNPCLRTQPHITRSDINGLLGAGNWHCLANYPTGVKVDNIPSGFVVQRPAIFVDKEDKRYYQGESVPSGGPATVWFPVSIANECP
jgi:hypothetical protein